MAVDELAYAIRTIWRLERQPIESRQAHLAANMVLEGKLEEAHQLLLDAAVGVLVRLGQTEGGEAKVAALVDVPTLPWELARAEGMHARLRELITQMGQYHGALYGPGDR